MPVMENSDLTPRQYWARVRSNPQRARFGFSRDAGVWGTRTDTPDSLQNIKEGSARVVKHEIPHFASLCDLMLKYADVGPVSLVRNWLAGSAAA